MILSSSLKDDLTPYQLERLFSAYQVFWQVLFYVLLALFVLKVVVSFLDSYAKRKYKQKLSLRNKRVVENYNSIDCFYLISSRRSKKQGKEEK